MRFKIVSKDGSTGMTTIKAVDKVKGDLKPDSLRFMEITLHCKVGEPWWTGEAKFQLPRIDVIADLSLERVYRKSELVTNEPAVEKLLKDELEQFPELVE